MINKKSLKNLKPFPKGKSGNPKGRPKKLVSVVNDELIKKGYRNVTPTNVKDAFLTLLNLPLKDILEIGSDDTLTDYPILYKLVAKELTGKNASDMLEKLLDRSIGKATASIDLTTNGKDLGINVLSIDPLKDESDDSTT